MKPNMFSDSSEGYWIAFLFLIESLKLVPVMKILETIKVIWHHRLYIMAEDPSFVTYSGK